MYLDSMKSGTGGDRAALLAFIFIIGFVFLSVSGYAATLEFVTPTQNSGTNTTNTFVYINISSTNTISKNGSTIFSWYDQAGANTNFTGNSTNAIVVNQTVTPFKNWTSYNFTGLSDGTHRFVIYVYANSSTPSTDVIAMNITVDTTAPTTTISSPTANEDIVVLESGTTSLVVNYSISDASSSASQCIYRMESSGGAGTIGNTSFTCSGSSFTIDTPPTGDVTLTTYVNDSANNLLTTTRSFKFGRQATGGASPDAPGGLGGYTDTSLPQFNIGQADGAGIGASQNISNLLGNRYVQIGIVLFALWLIFFRKKGRGRRKRR